MDDYPHTSDTIEQLRKIGVASEKAARVMKDVAKAIMDLADSLERIRNEPSLFSVQDHEKE